jgi:hypothetical protein
LSAAFARRQHNMSTRHVPMQSRGKEFAAVILAAAAAGK